MNIRPYRFKIIGVSPLLINSPLNMAPSTGTAVKKKVIPTPEEEAASKVYEKNGKYYLPTVCFRRALLYAVRGKRVGKRSAAAILQAAVFPGEECFWLLDDKCKKPLASYQIDIQPVVVQKARVLRARPRFEEWGGICRLDLDEELIDAKAVEENLAEAGVISGVGDFRVQLGGTFGRFTVSLMN